MKKNICLLITLFAVICVNAQIKIYGTVHDVNNVGIEYATVCADSIYTLTNKNGLFTLELPNGFNGPMTCTHIKLSKKYYTIFHIQDRNCQYLNGRKGL